MRVAIRGHGQGCDGIRPILTSTAVPGATVVPAAGVWENTLSMLSQRSSTMSLCVPSRSPTAESRELASPGVAPLRLGTATCAGGAGVGTGVGAGVGAGAGGGGGAVGAQSGGP